MIVNPSTDSQDFLHYRQMKVLYLSALSTVCPYPPGNTPGTYLCERLSRPHSEAGRIKAIKDLNDSIGNQTSELPACSEVPHRTAPTFVPSSWIKSINYEEKKLGNMSDLRWIVNNALRPYVTSGTSRPRPQYSNQKNQTFRTTPLRISEFLVFSRKWVNAVFRC